MNIAGRHPSRGGGAGFSLPVLAPVAAAVLGLVAVAPAADIRFGAEAYTAVPGEEVTIGSLIELAGGEAALFSYGVTMLYEGDRPTAVDFVDVRVPDALAFNGVAGPGTNTATGVGFAGAKGTVDPANSPLVGFTGPGFVEFALVFSEAGEYPFRLDLFNTLGPSEQIFVTVDGEVIDGDIVFGSTVVTVVPEPSSAALVVMAGMGAVVLIRRRGASRSR